MLDLKISSWNKWDLHFHTKSTFWDKANVNYLEEDLPKKIIEKVKLNSVNLLVITDHMEFNLGCYNKLINKTDESLTIIPGIEVNVKIESVKKYIQILVAFNPENINELIKFSDFINKDIKDDNEKVIKNYITLDDFVKYVYLTDTLIYWEYGKSRGFDQAVEIQESTKPIFDNFINMGFIKNFNLVPNPAIKNYNQEGRPDLKIKAKAEIETYFENFYNSDLLKKEGIFFTASDCHEIDYYPKKDKNSTGWNPTWFKAINNFNGLKLAFTENTRIYIDTNNSTIDPEKINNINYIKGISFEINGIKQEIKFSKYLNTIIGKRSSGKSLLFKLLSNKFEKNINGKQIDNVVISTNFNNQNDFEFFKQNEFIANGIENKEELSMIIEERGINKVETNEKENYNFFLNYFNFFLEILKNLNKIKLLLAKKRISDFWNYNDNNKISNKNESIWYFHKILNFPEILKHKNYVTENLKNDFLDIKSTYKSLIEKEEFIEKTIKENKLLINLDLNDNLNNFKNEILNIENNILPKFEKYIDNNNKIIKESSDLITNFKLKLKSFIDDQNVFNILETKREDIYYTWNEILKIIYKNKLFNNELLNKKNSNINFYENKNINSMDIDFNKISIIRSNKFTINESNLLGELFKFFFNIKSEKYLIEDNYWKKIEVLEFIYKKYQNFNIVQFETFKKELIQKIDIFIKINNKEINIESPGQRASTLLEILVNENNTKPLIIDQPEDNLDNNYIYQELTNKIKDMKKNRQIICISHNANIVINGDSENVIFSSIDNNSYDYGGIEYKDNIKFISTTLEGGKQAIRKRFEKISLLDKD